jgi:hypothetical protein
VSTIEAQEGKAWESMRKVYQIEIGCWNRLTMLHQSYYAFISNGRQGREIKGTYMYITFKTQVTIRFCTFKPQCPGRPCEQIEPSMILEIKVQLTRWGRIDPPVV